MPGRRRLGLANDECGENAPSVAVSPVPGFPVPGFPRVPGFPCPRSPVPVCPRFPWFPRLALLSARCSGKLMLLTRFVSLQQPHFFN